MTIIALKQRFSLVSINKEFIMFKKLLPLSTLLFTSMAFAQTNPLSVHVLNLENGLPSAQVEVVLEKSAGNKWVKLNQQYTGPNGRITALFLKIRSSKQEFIKSLLKRKTGLKRISKILSFLKSLSFLKWMEVSTIIIFLYC